MKIHYFTTTKGTMVKISSLLELRLVTSLSLNFLKMMVMLLARAVLQNRRIEANTKSFLEKKIDYFDDSSISLDEEHYLYPSWERLACQGSTAARTPTSMRRTAATEATESLSFKNNLQMALPYFLSHIKPCVITKDLHCALAWQKRWWRPACRTQSSSGFLKHRPYSENVNFLTGIQAQ